MSQDSTLIDVAATKRGLGISDHHPNLRPKLSQEIWRKACRCANERMTWLTNASWAESKISVRLTVESSVYRIREPPLMREVLGPLIKPFGGKISAKMSKTRVDSSEQVCLSRGYPQPGCEFLRLRSIGKVLIVHSEMERQTRWFAQFL